MMQTKKPRLNLSMREGEKPRTTHTNPHTQLDQNSEQYLIDTLAEWAFGLEGVEEKPSAISVLGARALWLKPDVPVVHPEALIIGREFAHIHPQPTGGSMHLTLPLESVEEVLSKGWGEPHPLVARGLVNANTIMVFAPRNEQELETIRAIVNDSYHFASGK